MQNEGAIHPMNAVQDSIGRELRDGYEVHRAALARGLNLRLLPRQVMEVSIPGDPANTASFSHGVPQATTLAGATYAQDLRMRRAMLSRAGYRQPRGATFSVGRSQNLARRFADRIGYPVVLKPAVGDNTIEVATHLHNAQDLKSAISYLYTPPSQREKFTRAAYALTELREPGRVNGKVVAPPGYRFLVEKHLRGKYLRFVVIDRQVRNVLYCPGGPWGSAQDEIQDVTESTHQTVKDVAVGAATAVPGLSVVALDMIVRDPRREAKKRGPRIVELSERPWLSVHHRYNPVLASELGAAILASELPAVSEREVQAKVTSKILIGGAVDPVTLMEVLHKEFTALGIEADLYESDHALGQISGTVTGAPEDIAWVMEQLLGEGVGGQRAMLLDSRSVQDGTPT